MTFLLSAFSGVLDTYLLYVFASGFCSRYKNTRSKWNYIWMGILFIAISCTPIPSIFRTACAAFAICLLLYITYPLTIVRLLAVNISYITITLLSEILCEFPFLLLGLSRDAILVNGLARCIYIILAKLVNFLLVSFIVSIFGNKGILEISFRELCPLIACQLISIFICVVLLELVGKISAFFLALLSVAVIGLLFINIIFFVYMRFIRTNYENKRQKELAEQQLQAQISYYQQVKDAQKQTRALWHDIKKQLNAVTALVQAENKEDAMKYLDDISDSFQQLDRVVDVEHPVVSAILNDAYHKAASLGIQMDMDVFISPSLSVSPLDLSVILGNTLDNAIQACSSLSERQPAPSIYIALRQKNSFLY